MEIPVHAIQLQGNDEFSNRFNHVSDLFQKAIKEDTKEAWNLYHDAKYALEQGLPIVYEN